MQYTGGMEIMSLHPAHLPGCAELVAERYRALRRCVPHLPARYEAAEEFVPRLAELLTAQPGVAAMDNDRLAGFLTGWRVPSIRGERGVYVPEWANGARDDARHVYQELYSALARQWVAEGYTEHFISLFAHDCEAVDTWFELGFGGHATDAVRSLDPAPGSLAGVAVRRADAADFSALALLEEGLQAHLRGAPTFLPVDPDEDHAEMRDSLQNAKNAIFLAERYGEAIGYVRFQPASTDAATIIRDGGTTSTTGAFTVKGARGGGVARALLNAGMAWAREAGYERCAVDFESANILAAGFWLRHFRPVTLSLRRHINPAVV
jgi:GNAT superfamily N-acetyltransferase